MPTQRGRCPDKRSPLPPPKLALPLASKPPTVRKVDAAHTAMARTEGNGGHVVILGGTRTCSYLLSVGAEPSAAPNWDGSRASPDPHLGWGPLGGLDVCSPKPWYGRWVKSSTDAAEIGTTSSLSSQASAVRNSDHLNVSVPIAPSDS
jgi:hypothetical protein